MIIIEPTTELAILRSIANLLIALDNRELDPSIKSLLAQYQQVKISNQVYYLLDKYKTAEILGVSTNTLKSWRLQGKLIERIHYEVINLRGDVSYRFPLIQHYSNWRNNPDFHQIEIDKFVNYVNSQDFD